MNIDDIQQQIRNMGVNIDLNDPREVIKLIEQLSPGFTSDESQKENDGGFANSKDFDLRIQQGVPFIEHNGKTYLVDTGSPITISESGGDFLGHKYNANQAIFSSISDNVDQKFNALLGMDILSKYNLYLKGDEKITLKNRDDSDFSGKNVSFNDSFQMIFVNNKGVNMVIDTGADVSYIKESLLGDDKEFIGKKDDFYPGVGAFTVDTYRTEIEVFPDEKIKLECAVLPKKIEALHSAFNISVILGYDFLKQYNLGVDFTNKKLFYEMR